MNNPRRAVVLAAAAAVAVLAVWYAAFFAPQGRRQEALRAELARAETAEGDLQVTLARLRRIAAELPARTADLQRLEQFVPAQPAVDGFIQAANDIASRSGVNWLSLVPSPPVARSGTGLSVINLTLQVEGGFFPVLDYLKRLEDLSRLVIIDSIDVNATPQPGPTSKLTVGLNARIFTSAPAPAAATPGSATPASATPAPATPPPETATIPRSPG